MMIVDIHSHILPGVDDGADSVESALEMLRIAAKEGITHIFATPHYRSGRYFTHSQDLDVKLSRLADAAKAEGIPLKLYGGTEIFYRSGLEEHLESGDLATLNHTEYVLIEFSPMDDFSYIRNGLSEIAGMGFHPVLAHAERYHCLYKRMDRVRELRGAGTEIQVNADSIIGRVGFGIKKYLHRLLSQGMVDYIGTDAHNTTGRIPRIKKCAKLLYRKYNADYVDSILYKNAMQNLLNGKKEYEGLCRQPVKGMM